MQPEVTTKQFSKAAIASCAFGIVSLLFMTILIIDMIDWNFFMSPQLGWFKNIQETLDDWNILVCIFPVVSAWVLGGLSIYRMDRSYNLKGKVFAVTGIIGGSTFAIFFLIMVLKFLFTGFR